MADSLLEALHLEAARRLLDVALVVRISFPNPAAGGEIIAAVPAGSYWELLGIRYTLVTSAAGGARTSSVTVRDGDGLVYQRFGPQATQAISLTTQYNYAAGYGVVNSQGPNAAPLPSPPIIVMGGHSIATLTGAIDVADQYQTIAFLVREISPSAIVQRVKFIQKDFTAVEGLGD